MTVCYNLFIRAFIEPPHDMMRIVSVLFLLLTFSVSASATPFVIDDVVDSHSNLFYTDWGHWYTEIIDGALATPGSNPARAVEFGGNSFNFAEFDNVSIEATGSVVAHFNVATDPDGCANSDPLCLFNDGNFRLLPAYALIGIWSSSATEIVPFGENWDDWTDIESGLGLMTIGSIANLFVPSAPFAYLFLATNDGGFADNSGEFNVHLLASVPEPGTLALLLAGILLTIAVRRRKTSRSFRN